MATATVEKKADTQADLLLILADADLPVSEVLAKVDMLTLASAWARGDIEFGRVAHCITGRPGIPESHPTLVVEVNMDWSGPKTPRHDRIQKVLADLNRVPECEKYQRYTLQELVGKDDQGVDRWRTLKPGETPEDGRETRWTTVRCTRGEAVAALTPRVRLTDKGLAALQS